MSSQSHILESEWNAILSQVSGLRDRLGKGLDPLIVQTVAGLKAYKFYTIASCEGHLDWGTGAPWVDISKENYAELKDAMQKVAEARKSITNESDPVKRREKEGELLADIHRIESDVAQELHQVLPPLFELLNKFYENRTVTNENRLVLRPVGALVVRLESQGALLQRSKSNRTEERLIAFQKEMQEFGEFLKKSFLANS